jgi:putative 4-mercaptohistidine N1-methyltranferase
VNPYETDRLLAEYLLFHYGTAADILPTNSPTGMGDAVGFPVRTVAHFSGGAVKRGLDLGCAVGRSSYEMGLSCETVLGIDFSRNFVRAAAALAQGPLTYARLEEGHQRTPMEATLPQGLAGRQVSFEEGDAMNLREDLGEFERVHAANLLCRLPEPLRLLERLPSLVVAGGELVLATPCTWLEEYTPPDNWPTGGTLEWLQQHLEASFELLRTADEPFLIRETARKFQWTRSQVSVWRRKQD